MKQRKSTNRRLNANHLEVRQYSHSMPVSPIRSRNRRRRSSMTLISQTLITREQLVKPQSKLHKVLRVQFVLLIIAAVVVASVYWEQTLDYCRIVIDWISAHPYEGSGVVMALPVVLAVLGLPLSPILGVGCGYAYYQQFEIPGVVVASGILWIGSCLGSIAAFFISRYLFRDCILKMAKENTKFQMLEAIIKKHGFKVSVLIRISPLMPFEIENYVLGVSSIRFCHYTLGLIALLPGCAFYCVMGSTLSNLSDISNVEQALTESPVGLSLIVISLVGMIVGSIVAARRFEDMENEIADEEELVHLVDSIESTVELSWREEMLADSPADGHLKPTVFDFEPKNLTHS